MSNEEGGGEAHCSGTGEERWKMIQNRKNRSCFEEVIGAQLDGLDADLLPHNRHFETL